MNIKPLQADIIFHTLGYVAEKEGVKISKELQEVYRIMSENNPNDTDVIDIVDIMEYLAPILKKEYSEYFEEEE